MDEFAFDRVRVCKHCGSYNIEIDIGSSQIQCKDCDGGKEWHFANRKNFQTEVDMIHDKEELEIEKMKVQGIEIFTDEKSKITSKDFNGNEGL